MHRKGFSLASILLLTAVVAVFLAAMCRAWLDPRGLKPELAVGCAVVGLLAGVLVGVVIGSNQIRRVAGIFLGLVVGMISGAAAGVLLSVPNTLPAIAVGSLLIVLFGVVVRLYSGRLPDE